MTARIPRRRRFLYVDSLGGFYLMTVAAVTLLAAVGAISYVAAQEDDGELTCFQVRLYFSFFGLFASLMLAALETGNLGLLFVLVEASTLASAALVGLEGVRGFRTWPPALTWAPMRPARIR